ncbi:MAG: hypothetical protein D6796_16190, partial [Caldilineae bacterium]
APAPANPLSPPPAASTSAGDRFLAELRAQTEALKRSTEERKKRRGFFPLGGRGEPVELPEVPTFNLAEQIDEILQEKLRQANISTPVKIHSGPKGQIQIQVGARMYDAVDAVEDAQIRAIIQSAIDAW